MAEEEGQGMYIKEVGKKGLDRYKHAVSANNILTHVKEDSPMRQYVLGALRDLWVGFGNDPDDYVLNKMIGDSMEMAQRGHGSVSELASGVISQYAQKHELVTLNTEIGKYVAHVGVKLPKKVKELVEKYKGLKVGELDKIENEDDKKAMSYIISSLKQNYELGGLTGGFIKDNTRKSTESGLEHLAKELDDKKKK
jgi:hypothetical protein